MYKDFFPPLPIGIVSPTPVVAVITRNERVRPEAVIAVCHKYGATSQQSEGLCFWVVFEDEPRRAWPKPVSATAWTRKDTSSARATIRPTSVIVAKKCPTTS